MVSPCLHCTTRSQNCHSKCDKYIGWCKRMEERRKVIRENKRGIYDANGFEISIINKIKRRMR